jgi:hypothetical protein
VRRDNGDARSVRLCSLCGHVSNEPFSHSETRYVMNYLRLLVVYSETPSILLDDSNDDNPFPSSEAQDEEHLEIMTWKVPSEADVLFGGQFGGKF